MCSKDWLQVLLPIKIPILGKYPGIGISLYFRLISVPLRLLLHLSNQFPDFLNRKANQFRDALCRHFHLQGFPSSCCCISGWWCGFSPKASIRRKRRAGR